MENYQYQGFEGLLEQGRISEGLQLRIENLETEAYNTRLSLEAAKAVSGGSLLLGIVLSANPMIALLAGVGGALYAATLWQDYSSTRRLCPLPGVRKSINELIFAAGKVDKGSALASDRRQHHQQQQQQQPVAEDPLLQVLSYLEPVAADEYELLVSRESALAGFLKSFQPHERIAAYRFAVRHARLQSALQLPTTAEAREAIAIPAPSPTAALPAVAEPQDAARAVVELPATAEPIAAESGEPVAPPPELQSGPVSSADEQTDSRYAWAKDLLHFPAVLVWGPQGSGKTSFAAWLLKERLKAGHKAWVCDPHKEYGQWEGLSVIGAGMDYEACDRALLAFANTVKQAYQDRAEQPDYQPKRETLVVEEFTNWSDRCKHSAEFFKSALTDLRKIKKCVIFVSHDNSLLALGGSQGMGKAKNAGLLQLELEAKIDPITKEPRSAQRGKLKYPGKPAIEVELADWMNGSMDFTSAHYRAENPKPKTDVRSRLETLYHSESAAEPSVEPVEATSFAPATGSSSTTEPLEKLSRYLQSKGKIDLRTLDKNWGRNNGFQGEALKDLLTQLESQGSIVTWGDGIIWKG